VICETPNENEKYSSLSSRYKQTVYFYLKLNLFLNEAKLLESKSGSFNFKTIEVYNQKIDSFSFI
jgi:hypothetical protein